MVEHAGHLRLPRGGGGGSCGVVAVGYDVAGGVA